MKNRMGILYFFAFLVFLNQSCKKQNSTQNGTDVPVFTYRDSIFYQRNQAQDYIITPTANSTGKYLSFPDGLVIDGNTGAINVSKSETGLKYAIAFIPDQKKDTLLSFLTISGINYLDGFYLLTGPDSIATSIYNAVSASIPGLNNGSVFDVGSSCNTQGCAVNTINGTINLAQTVRNGVFGATPANNDRHEFEMTYQINDNSNETANKLNVKLYYFNTMSDVTQEAYDIINSRTGSIIGASNTVPAFAFSSSIAKPRPPCIFIVGH